MRYIYIRIGPQKVEQLEVLNRPLTKEEARVICRQLSPSEVISLILGNEYDYTLCLKTGMESSMKLAEMIKTIMLRAVLMNIKPRRNDKRSQAAYHSWVRYFVEKGLLKVQQ